jgi:hypothetical protein
MGNLEVKTGLLALTLGKQSHNRGRFTEILPLARPSMLLRGMVCGLAPSFFIARFLKSVRA